MTRRHWPENRIRLCNYTSWFWPSKRQQKHGCSRITWYGGKIEINTHWDTDSFSDGEISAIHLMTIVIRTIAPPPIRLKANERRAAEVAQS